MSITEAIKELKDNWGYESAELNHIRSLMEEIGSECYNTGYADGQIDYGHDAFISYGK